MANGDPLDVMVLMDEPAHVGCLVDVRLIGVIEAVQVERGKSTRNDRLIGVSVHSYSHEDVSALNEVGKTLLAQLEEFFICYNKQRGKKFKVIDLSGPKRAGERLETGIRNFKKNKK